MLSTDTSFSSGEAMKIVRCRACGLARTDPSPTREAIAAFYPPDYGPHRQPPSSEDRLSRWRHLTRHVDLKVDSVPEMPVGRMIEFGCGNGSFLRRMATAGWEVSGIEPSPRAASGALAQGIDVHVGSVEEAPGPGEPVDLVVAWMALEHVHNPVEVLRKVRGWTRPGGWIALSTPNIDTFQLKVFGQDWYSLSLPVHLFHFTPATLNRVLVEAGWVPRRLFHQRVLSDLVASSGLKLRRWGRATGLAERLARWPEKAGRQHLYAYPFAWVLAALGQSGRMTVWAQNEQ